MAARRHRLPRSCIRSSAASRSVIGRQRAAVARTRHEPRLAARRDASSWRGWLEPDIDSRRRPRCSSRHDRFQDIRDAIRGTVRAVSARRTFRRVDEARGYPEAFVDALTKAGWLAALIPQRYGGSGLGLTEASVIMEEINRSGGNSGACHGQMYNMGTLLRHGSEAQKRGIPAEDRERRAAPAVDGRHRADDRHRHDEAAHDRRCARATATSSTARRSGSRASSIPT